ncbi:acetyl-CoA acetyltransferase, cytosolic 1-like protein, partial [Tanacetum coccineum]
IPLGVGIPNTVVSTSINKVCASGMKATMLAAQSIQLGINDVVMAGGMESMSNLLFFPDYPKIKSEVPYRKGSKFGHDTLVDGMVKDWLWGAFNDFKMGNCGEICADMRQGRDMDVGKKDLVKDGYAHINTITCPPGSPSDDPMGDIGNVEISETLEVVNESTASAPNEDDPDRGKIGNIGVVEISETLKVKNENAASSPASSLTKPTLTLLDSKRKNRNRSSARKTTSPNTTSEAPNASTSNRHQRKSWISLKEIAKRNEKRRSLF